MNYHPRGTPFPRRKTEPHSLCYPTFQALPGTLPTAPALCQEQSTAPALCQEQSTASHAERPRDRRSRPLDPLPFPNTGGDSINLSTLRQPSQVGILDSCPFGMGGFTWTGQAWRIRIPPSSVIYAGMSETNNVLEFLAMAITLWLIILDCVALDLTDECILGLGDNTSAICWIFQSTRLPPKSAYYAPVQLIARKVARLTTESQQCLCAQHLKGGSTFISDWLLFTTQTRDGKTNPVAFDDPADDLLTNQFHSSFPQLIPQHFEISPLPEEILSFVDNLADGMWASALLSCGHSSGSFCGKRVSHGWRRCRRGRRQGTS
jgi:hypothetical protein